MRVGAFDQCPAFIRQNEMMALFRSGLDVQTDRGIDGTYNHVTVIEGLRRAKSPIMTNLVEEVDPSGG